jgi:hypothetical protein
MLDSPGRQEVYRRRDATRALAAAMTDLAERLGRSPESVEEMTLGEAYDLALAHYETLPEFWRIWADWQQVRPAPMGDL